MKCAKRRYGCYATGQMNIEDGSPILLSEQHPHNHEPQPRYDRAIRGFFNHIRERGALNNIQPQVIFNEDAQL